MYMLNNRVNHPLHNKARVTFPHARIRYHVVRRIMSKDNKEDRRLMSYASITSKASSENENYDAEIEAINKVFLRPVHSTVAAAQHIEETDPIDAKNKEPRHVPNPPPGAITEGREERALSVQIHQHT